MEPDPFMLFAARSSRVHFRKQLQRLRESLTQPSCRSRRRSSPPVGTLSLTVEESAAIFS